MQHFTKDKAISSTGEKSFFEEPFFKSVNISKISKTRKTASDVVFQQQQELSTLEDADRQLVFPGDLSS